MDKFFIARSVPIELEKTSGMIKCPKKDCGIRLTELENVYVCRRCMFTIYKREPE